MLMLCLYVDFSWDLVARKNRAAFVVNAPFRNIILGGFGGSAVFLEILLRATFVGKESATLGWVFRLDAFSFIYLACTCYQVYQD